MPPDHENYPMPPFLRLAVSDVKESTGRYGALGFDVDCAMPVVVLLRYRGHADVVLADASFEDVVGSAE